MSELKIDGNIKEIRATEYVGSNNFAKRLLVIETGGQYSKDVPITFLGDKAPLLDNYQVGQAVTVHLNLSGNEYEGRWYPNINGWKIGFQNAQPQPQAQPAPTPTVDPLAAPAPAPAPSATPAPAPAPTPEPAQQAAPAPTSAGQQSIDDIDDDLPF